MDNALSTSYTRLELTVAYAHGHHFIRFIPLTEQQAKDIERVLRNGPHLELDLLPINQLEGKLDATTS